LRSRFGALFGIPLLWLSLLVFSFGGERLFSESGDSEKAHDFFVCGREVSDGKGRCPLTPRRAIGPLDTLFFCFLVD